MKGKRKNSVFPLVGLIVFVAGCSLHNENSVTAKNEDEVPGASSGFQRFLEKNGLVKNGDYYLFEDDILFSGQEVEKIYQVSTGVTRGHLSPYKWTISEARTLTYKFETDMHTPSLSDAQVKDAFRAATNVWMSACANIRFSETTGTSRVGVRMVKEGRTGSNMRSHLPKHLPDGTSNNKIYVNFDEIEYVNGAHDFAYNTVEKMTGIFTHELGHTLGLLHEHSRKDAGADVNWAYDYRKGEGTPFGAYDPDSIMNYRNSPYTRGLSAGDRATIYYLYGMKAYISISPPTPYAYALVYNGVSGQYTYTWELNGVRKYGVGNKIDFAYEVFVGSRGPVLDFKLIVTDLVTGETASTSTSVSAYVFYSRPY